MLISPFKKSIRNYINLVLFFSSLSLGCTQGAPFQASFMANYQGQLLFAHHRSLSDCRSLAVVVFLLTRFDFKPSLEFQSTAGLLCFGWFKSFLDLVNNLVKLSLWSGIGCWIICLQSNMGLLGFFLYLIWFEFLSSVFS